MRIFIILFALLTHANAFSSASRQTMLPDDEWVLKTNDNKYNLYVREIGQGEPIIVLHGGWGAEHSYLLEAFQPFANNHRFVFYDQRGSLRSPCIPDIDPGTGEPNAPCLAGAEATVENHISDLEQLRATLGVNRLTLIGHSMGGFLAMSYQSAFPDHVAKIILLGSPPATGDEAVFQQSANDGGKRLLRPSVADEMKRNGLDLEKCRNKDSSYTPKQLTQCHRITFAAVNLHSVGKWQKLALNFFSPYAAQQGSRSMNKSWNFLPQLNAGKIPIHVIHGDDDYVSIGLAEGWIKSAPHAQLHPIPNAGHCSWIDQPLIFKSVLLQALSGH